MRGVDPSVAEFHELFARCFTGLSSATRRDFLDESRPRSPELQSQVCLVAEWLEAALDWRAARTQGNQKLANRLEPDLAKAAAQARQVIGPSNCDALLRLLVGLTVNAHLLSDESTIAQLRQVLKAECHRSVQQADC